MAGRGLAAEDIDAPDEPVKAKGLVNRLNSHAPGRPGGNMIATPTSQHGRRTWTSEYIWSEYIWIWIWIVIWFNCGLVAVVLGQIKNRSGSESFFLGFIFGVIGLIIVIFLPPGMPQAPPGMRAVKCPRCNAVENLPRTQSDYICWQCHTANRAPSAASVAGSLTTWATSAADQPAPKTVRSTPKTAPKSAPHPRPVGKPQKSKPTHPGSGEADIVSPQDL